MTYIFTVLVEKRTAPGVYCREPEVGTRRVANSVANLQCPSVPKFAYECAREV